MKATKKILKTPALKPAQEKILTADKNDSGSKLGIACGGISYAYVCESLQNMCDKDEELIKIVSDIRILKIGTPHPFPEKLAYEFLQNAEKVLVVEELDPMIERMLLMTAGKYHLDTDIKGKLTGHVKNAGENTTESVTGSIKEFIGITDRSSDEFSADAGDDPEVKPELPVRPPGR